MPHERYMEQGMSALFDENKLCCSHAAVLNYYSSVVCIFNGFFSKVIKALALSVASSVQLEEVSSLT